MGQKCYQNVILSKSQLFDMVEKWDQAPEPLGPSGSMGHSGIRESLSNLQGPAEPFGNP